MKRENLTKLPMIAMILVGALLLTGCTEQSPQPLAPETTNGASNSTPQNQPTNQAAEPRNVREFKSGESDPEVIPEALEVSPE